MRSAAEGQPRPKVKSRIEHLADAHAQLLKAQSSLAAVDLRSTAGELRTAIREAREQVAAALVAAQTAIRSDVPVPQRRRWKGLA